MSRPRSAWRVVVALACVAGAACSTVLGLQPPPAEDAGGTATTATDAGATDAGTTDAGTTDAKAADAPAVDGATSADANTDSATAPVVCAPLDREDDAESVYSALTLTGDDGGVSPWDAFDTALLPRRDAFAGGTFDGTYVYLAGRATVMARYDIAQPFESVGSWTEFDVSTVGIPGGFEGAVFDGRYVYFVPYLSGATHEGVVARFDTAGSFTCGASWASFDLATLLPDAGTPLTGYWGAGFDGRYVYFVPHNDGAPFGVVVRYDTTPPDAGVAAASGLPHACGPDGGVADAGDAGDAGSGPATFGGAAQWQTFDLSTVNPTAIGYLGAVFDGTSLYLVPSINDAYGGEIHGGASGVVARLRTAGAFDAAASWSTFDLTTVNGLLTNFMGGAFDSRYLYLAPRGSGIAPRFDTTGGFTSTTAWSTYDMTRLFAADAATPDYAGAAFDGRFVYYVPAGNGFVSLTRYDTRSAFGADCAWSTIDLSQLDLGDAGPAQYVGAVFDGQYLYLVPDGVFPVLRFDARTPPRQPMLPGYSGSFL